VSGDLHALLIGIDQYIPPRSGAGVCYPPLTGAVRDVRRVRELLVGLPTPPVRILELTASPGNGPEPVEPRERWPTYETMVGKFRELTAGADPGDQVYIHYSGHGGRTPTLFPDQKGPRDFDESLVPCDITDPEERYLRDVEVAKLVQEMVDKGLFVTVVLDCCHSGGMSRGLRHPVPRGLSVPDGRRRPTASLVGTREELARFLRPREIRAQGSRTVRHARVEGWLVEPRGYVLMTACRPQETAFEYPISAEETQGALTYRLLEALRERSSDATWQEIHDVVFSRVHDQFQKQAPMLFGEKWRTFLGVDPVDPPVVERAFELRVLGVEKDWLLLAAGRSQGVREGMRFAVYPPAMNREGAGRRAAIVEVTKAGATECKARIVATERDGSRVGLGPGGVAIPLDGVAIQRPAVCAVVSRQLPQGLDQVAALDRVCRALEQDRSGALKAAGEGEAVDFQVAINERGEYEIADEKGNPLPNLGPPLAIAAVGAESDLLRRLIHLAKYFDLLRNDNEDRRSPLRDKLRLAVLGVESPRRPGEEPALRPFSDDAPREPIELRPGESLVLEVENGSSQALNVVVIDLQPDWGIEQIFPKKRDGEFWTLDPKQKKTVKICGYLPEGCQESSDIIKVFATIGIPSFLWMELPPLYRVAFPSRTTRSVRGTSEDKTFAANHLTFNEFASKEWTTAQLEVRVQRER
jgi:hypothetical protein